MTKPGNLFHIFVGAGCLLLGLSGKGIAQPPASIVPVSPQAPTLNLPQPLGISAGSSVELVLTGSNLNDPVAFISNLPAKATFPTDANNTKDAAKLRVKLEVPATAPVGMYPIRIATKQGVSNFRTLCIDDLPAAPAASGNRTKANAMLLPIPSVATGRIDAETSDFYKIVVPPGYRLSLEVVARRIGSTLDPIILLHDAKTGRELPSLYSDDSPGLQTDARLTHTFKEGGEFIVEIRDSTHRGGADYWYRLRVGNFPCAITPMPLAAKRGSNVAVNFAGPDLDGISPVQVSAPADPAVNAISVVPKGARPHSGWPVSLLLSDHDEVIEAEPNNEPAKANRVAVPCGISARFQEKSDLDHFVFTLKKGQRVLINSQTQELLSPADLFMILKDAKGGEVGRSNPQAGTGIDYTAPADGDFTLMVEHLNYLHGPNEVYHITIEPPAPDFDVVLSSERVDIPQNGTGVLPIANIVRRNYAGPIEVSIVGHPGITGSVNVTAAAPPAANLPIAVLPITAKPDVKAGAYEVRIQAKAMINGNEVKSFASSSAAIRAAMGNLPFPPREFETAFFVAVGEPPFRIAAKYAHPEGVRGQPIPLTITASRVSGFTEDITLTVVGLPPNVTAAAKPIAKNTNEVQFPLTAAANAPLGSFGVIVVGRGKFQNRDFAVAIPATLTISLPIEVQATAPAPLNPGATTKFKVTVVRKGGYAGPIDLEVKNLPANVTAPKAQIPAGKNDVEIELSAAANAAVGDKADVNVTGTAAGQAVPSANFTVKVVKK